MPMTLAAQLLRLARRARGLTQREASIRLLGVERPATICRYERGDARPRRQIRLRLERQWQVPADAWLQPPEPTPRIQMALDLEAQP